MAARKPIVLNSGELEQLQAADTVDGLEIGTDVQAFDAELAAIAGLTSAADKIPRFTGDGTADLIDFKDEDDMASDSNTAVASQQSVKAYADAAAALKVAGPVSSTDDAIARFDGVGGLTLQDSTARVLDTGALELNSTAVMEEPLLGAENLDEIGWTSTNWTGGWAVGWDHTTGNVSPLSHPFAPTAGLLYKIAWTVSNRTAGTFSVAFGGITTTSQSATGLNGYKATSAGVLTITPTSDFDGTIVLSVKEITGSSTPIVLVKDTTGVEAFAIRAPAEAIGSMCVGPGSGSFLLTGQFNILVGVNAGQEITTGSTNMCFGSQAGRRTSTGSGNVYIGSGAGQNGTDNSFNVLLGASAGLNNTGGANIGIGVSAGRNLTGSSNIFIGTNAGNSGQLTSASSSIGIGSSTTASNQAVFGGTGITQTILRGVVEMAGGFLVNDAGADVDCRIEGDSLSHMFFIDASAATENIALLAGAAPNWQSMDGGLFIANGTTIPTGNPTGGGFLYVENGALTWRGSSGTVTVLGAA